MQETLYLLGSKANAKRLMASITQLRAGKAETKELIRSEQSKPEVQAVNQIKSAHIAGE